MDQPLKWLPDASGTVWEPLGRAMQAGLPVPAGFIVFRSTPEQEVRAAYEQMKIRERTHFVAVRGATHPLLNVIGPDPLIHTLRRLWAESPAAPVLVQRMVTSIWCGKAQGSGTHLKITANEGMLLLDPDTYEDGHVVLSPKQRRMIRHVDGTPKVVERDGGREPIPAELLAKIRELAGRASSNIGWAIDDLEKIWLLACEEH